MRNETEKSSLKISIRQMGARDVDQVVTLERTIFPDPWPRSAFVEQVSGSGWGGIVAEVTGAVIGYACYLVVDVEAHITNIAVEPGYRRKSVARQLLEAILQAANRAGCEYVLLEVRPSNVAAIAFYKRFGFKLLYQRPNYYRRPVEDALIMVRYFRDG